jgi:hypothetical protein
MTDTTKELSAENAENAEKKLDIKFKTKSYKLNSAVSACSAVKNREPSTTEGEKGDYQCRAQSRMNKPEPRETK